jgi:hypothetical protein
MRTHEKYFLKTEKIDNGSGSWNYVKCEIYSKNNDGSETRCGEYIRKYSSYAEETFSPFTMNGKDYALYSSDYTTVRVMSLPDCIDIGGREKSSNGFCPVEIYIPRYTYIKDYEGERRDWVFFENSTADVSGEEKYDRYAPFAIMIGCVWGDDSSWKYRFIDLSEADKGILKEDERFGYIWTPNTHIGRKSLQELVSIHAEENTGINDIMIEGMPYLIQIELATSVMFRYNGNREDE